MCWKSLSKWELRNVSGGMEHYLSLRYAVTDRWSRPINGIAAKMKRNT
jgi:hypothetical protein